jgi:hypothetical protein
LHGRGNLNPTTELTGFVRPGFPAGDASAKTAELVCSAAVCCKVDVRRRFTQRPAG